MNHNNSESKQQHLHPQFLHAQKMESFGLLAGGIAHDFNNILSGVLGFSDLALSTLPEQHKSVEYIEHIRDAGERAARLTRQLLAFSRRQILKTSAVDVNSLLTSMTSMLSRLIGEDIEIILNTELPVNPVIADHGQLEQVIMNLMVNARDAMPEGGKITITANDIVIDDNFCRHEGCTRGPYVLIRLTDTGTGISTDIQEKIFEPFYTTKEKGKGTGLGLSTVYGIVKQHHGFIRLTSKPGQGSTFDVYLPSCQAEELLPQPKIETKDQLQGNETIMVVEDDQTVRHLIVETLQSEGYSILSAANAEKAAKSIIEIEKVIDLVLTDVVMTGMSGIKLAALIKQKRPETKVILMSGYSNTVLEKHGVWQNDAFFIQKPLSPIKLLTQIRATLDS